MNVPRPSLTTLSNCDQERIHSPGSIQPHGFMFVLEPATWLVIGASTNVKEFFWQETTALIGTPVATLLGEDVSTRLTALQGDPDFTRRAMLVRNTVLQAGDKSFPISLAAHRAGDVVLLEGELAADPDAIRTEEDLQGFLGRLNQAATLSDLFQLAVKEVRRIAGFDRCLLYRFDPDWNGTVIAEDRNGELPSYLNQRFPATDIPKPARELYARNRLRLIPTNNYRPVPISMRSGQKNSSSLDLTFSLLRSVSPIHLEYMRNMGTGSSMSISVLCDGQLWGLISCHSLKPRSVPFASRTVCDLLGQILSSQIATREQGTDLALKAELAGISARLLRNLAQDPSPGKNWAADDMLALTRSTGAAVVHGNVVKRFGHAPSDAEINSLAAHVLAQDDKIAFWDKIPAEFSTTLNADGSLSGLLGIVLAKDTTLLWFRPEIIQVVEWSGDPRKGIDKAGEGHSFLHPRKSFEAWKETVRGRSLPWERAVISVVREFQGVASGVIAQAAGGRSE